MDILSSSLHRLSLFSNLIGLLWTFRAGLERNSLIRLSIASMYHYEIFMIFSIHFFCYSVYYFCIFIPNPDHE
ncbi:unnamed protein product [Diamesa tonsa]